MKNFKWILPVCIAFLILCVVVSAGCNITDDGPEITEETYFAENTVKESNDLASITLTIPSGWEYETKTQDEDFCISFWPEGVEKGRIEVWYYDMFGMCGTGLTEEKITLGKYKANKGTYDENVVWQVICIQDLDGDCVIMNQNADKWLKEKNDEVMQILSSIVVTEVDTSK